MDSSTQHAGQQPTDGMPVPAPVLRVAEPLEPGADQYAQAELELRHERIERMIARALKLDD